jgi:hypothetical protein
MKSWCFEETLDWTFCEGSNAFQIRESPWKFATHSMTAHLRCNSSPNVPHNLRKTRRSERRQRQVPSTAATSTPCGEWRTGAGLRAMSGGENHVKRISDKTTRCKNNIVCTDWPSWSSRYAQSCTLNLWGLFGATSTAESKRCHFLMLALQLSRGYPIGLVKA